MKPGTFRAPRPFVATVAQARTILRGSGHLAATQWQVIALTVLATVCLAFLLFPHDAQLLVLLHASAFARSPATLHASALLGTWGDYPTYNLPLAILLWLYGYFAKNRAWRRLAVICFLGGTLAGLGDDCFRLTLGRPRPDAHLPDGFYGLHSAFHSRFQSFPSGHAAAVFGTAVALLVTRRWIGLLATAYALLVAWARLELNRHYPSDVLVGAILGIGTGLLIGYGARVRQPPQPPPPA